MPHFHRQYSGTQSKSDGQHIAIPPHIALATIGPVIQIVVLQTPKVTEVLMQKGIALSPPQQGNALIDTGASNTCIDIAIAQALGLPVIDVTKIASASHSSTECNIYPVRFVVPGVFTMNLDIERAIGVNLQSQGIIALIGRDVLKNCTLYYNGPMGQITLSA